MLDTSPTHVYVPLSKRLLGQVLDGLPNGQSLGKRLLRIKVVDEQTGTPCSYVQSIIRNGIGLLDIFDWIFIFGEKRQRLGDRLAKTVVVEA